MPSSNFELLPAELLQRICRYLDDEHRSSLLALALVSRPSYVATTPLLFRTIIFPVLEQARPTESIQNYSATLQRSTSFKHVRRLVLGSGLRSAEMVDWKPLIGFIIRLPSLTDLVYRCPTQLPRGLLETLHRYRPDCRLHIEPFQLYSLKAPELDAYDLMLVTSPCLYSIVVDSDSLQDFIWTAKRVQSHSYDVVIQMISGHTPHLKEVQVRNSHPRTWEEDSVTEYQSWRGLSAKEFKQSPPRGSLQALWHSGHSTIIKQVIEDWKASNDFSVLQTLNLESVISHKALEILANIAFPSLRALKLHLRENDSERLVMEYFNRGEQFLHNLQPLSELEILGKIRSINFDPIFDRHGSTLRKLRLMPGDIFEIGTYKSLGSLPRLQHPILSLDPGDPALIAASEIDDILALLGVNDELLQQRTDPSFDHFDRQVCRTHRGYRNGHVKDAMINCAVDQTLALAIFNVISSAKPADALHLESLEVEVWRNGGLGHTPFFDVLYTLGLSWIVERSPRDDARDELIVRELRVDRREREEAIAWNMGNWSLAESWSEIFRRIWPAKEETWQSCYEWRQDWYSFPLSDPGT